MKYVSKVKTRSGDFLPVRVSDMSRAHAEYWDTHVQGRIESKRADKDWNWLRIRLIVGLGGRALFQKPRALIVGIEADRQFQPCIMLLLLERYPALHDPQRSSVFVWYLSPAPTNYFVEHLAYPKEDSPHASHLMAIGMDVALTHSYNCGLSGLVGLHADEGGGDDLMNWYKDAKKGGMSLLPEGEPLPPGFRRLLGNDGRYFYHDEGTAESASKRMDIYR